MIGFARSADADIHIGVEAMRCADGYRLIGEVIQTRQLYEVARVEIGWKGSAADRALLAHALRMIADDMDQERESGADLRTGVPSEDHHASDPHRSASAVFSHPVEARKEAAL